MGPKTFNLAVFILLILLILILGGSALVSFKWMKMNLAQKKHCGCGCQQTQTQAQTQNENVILEGPSASSFVLTEDNKLASLDGTVLLDLTPFYLAGFKLV